MTDAGRGALAAPAVLVGAGILWLATGVEAGDAALYIGYEALLVVAPGCLLFRALSPRRADPLTILAIGWPLGLALELASFALTAALDVRAAFPLLQVLAAALAGIVWWRRRRPADVAPGHAAGLTPAQCWVLAALCLIAFAYVGLTLAAKSPIPGSVSNVYYDPDYTFHIAIVAEAANHWPLESPQVAGEPLHYHYFAHLHMAAASQVTGIDPAIVYLRLFTIPVVSLVLLQLAFAGRVVSGIGWAGPIAAALFLLGWAVDLSIPDLAPFLGLNPVFLQASPSYSFGLAFFLPLTVVVAGWLGGAVRERIGMRGVGAWSVVTLALALGAAGGKAVSLPLLIGGLAVYAAWSRWRTRELDATAVGLAAGGAAVLLAALVAIYGGGGSGGLRPAFAQVFEGVPVLVLLSERLPASPVAEALFWPLGAAACTLIVFGPPLLGLWWVAGRGRPPLEPSHRFLLSLLPVGLAGYLFLHADVSPEAYFAYYAVAAALPLSALGFCRGLSEWAAGRAGPRWPALAGAAGFTLLMLCLAWVGWRLSLDGRPVAALAAVYPVLGIGLAALLVHALRSPPARRQSAVALFTLCLFAPAGLDLALDTVPETVRTVSEDRSLYDSATPGTTQDVYEAAVWIRDNLDEDAVLAVSNHGSRRERLLEPGNADFPAFAQHRTFLEGWTNTGRSFSIGRDSVAAAEVQPFPERRELERRVFGEGDPGAVCSMRRDYGVTHLVVDRRRGTVPPNVGRVGRLVFANAGVLVYALGDGRGPYISASSCARKQGSGIRGGSAGS